MQDETQTKQIMMKYSFILFLCVLTSVKAHSKIESEIDRLLKHSWQEYADMKLISSLETAQKALILSRKNQYDKGIGNANVYIANVLFTIGIYKEGLVYLQKAEQTDFYKSQLSMQVEVRRLRGRAYTSLKMYKQSVQQYREQLKISERITNKETKNLSVLFTYENLAHTFEKMNQRDSAWFYIVLQEKFLKENFKEEDAFYYYATAYAQEGRQYIHQKEYQAARVSLEKSLYLLKKYKAPLMYNTLDAYGDLEAALGNNKQALQYYKEAIYNSVKLGAKEATCNQYKVLADFYMNRESNIEESNQYLRKHQKLKDELDAENKELIELALNHILELKENEHQNRYTGYVYVMMVGTVLFSGISVISYKHIRKQKLLLKEKEELFSEMEAITEELEKKIEGDKFNNLIALAKKNSPEFIILFKELYPGFITALKNRNPKIRSSELAFCAMAYLNFSTKDIAVYTSVTVHAVEMRKSRLRKKYNVPSDIDFNIWMRKLEYLGI
ncbi:tetratricopeptide repeat protein [Elizabethkingia meningoseptica]|nr:tetratricopeptide repeat protein [Elizabethkingia meningoseptica]MDE5469188.1 tetratricopeptide repeat protein [Elizabethkingia meningoseptica]MDE5475102.1 tetratricopeptide repeat protein [Elizabethkingia meningoseptica]MDE5478535.1 tetratricopeptide repeat protein [Elizabethkingia meningoseptica]MDE5486229.1 tetratricopeptide repeat protein [Elizabethkingia meningoseptica]